MRPSPGYRRPARRSRILPFRVWFLFTVAWGLALSGGPFTHAAEPQVRCPDCNERGKMPCPECDGRGHLEQNCSSCNGRGQKSCPVCTKNMNEAGDGRVSCNLCSGDGSIAATGKSCSRCAGVGSSACLTCGGKAVRSCVPRVYGGRCPTCRSARRVPCRTCGGDKRVTEAVRARRLRVKNTAAIARAAAVSAKPGKKKSLGANARPASRVTGSVEATAEETPPPATAGRPAAAAARRCSATASWASARPGRCSVVADALSPAAFGDGEVVGAASLLLCP